MDNRSEHIKALKNIFDKVKSALRDEEGCFVDLRLRGELFKALTLVGQDSIYELKDELYDYIYDEYDDFRELAVRALGSCNGLQLEEFRDVAFKIWKEDPSDVVKVAAISAWAGYYRDTKDPMVLKYLYNIFRSNKFSISIRVFSLYGFMNVADAFTYPNEQMDVLDLDDLENNSELTKAIDWGKVYRIMKQYVPGWDKN